MSIVFAILGMIGAAFAVGAFALLQAGRLTSADPRFYAANGIGALLIGASIAADFDMADIGGIAVELAWVAISIMGLMKYWKTRKAL
jgi:hypothetical protein